MISGDKNGSVVAARAGQNDHVADVFGAELLAVEKALDVAAELGVVHLIIETDSLLVEQALNKRGPDFSRQAHVSEDMKMKMNLWFASCEIHHCRREANMPAHHLAELGLSLRSGEVLVSDVDVPAIVADAVMGDLGPAVA